jgi:hypothetical protein
MGPCSSRFQPQSATIVARTPPNNSAADLGITKARVNASGIDLNEGTDGHTELIGAHTRDEKIVAEQHPGRPQRLTTATTEGSSETVAGGATRKRRLSVPVATARGDFQSQLLATAADMLPNPVKLGESAVISSIGCASCVGKEPGCDKKNQDMVVVVPELGCPHQSLFCVLDGHGQSGHLVANFGAKSLTKELASPNLTNEDVHRRLWEGILATNKLLTNGSKIDCTLSGATLTASVLQGNKLTTAWVGDSRAMLARREGSGIKAYDITVDHKPTLPEERRRILESGGRVEPLMVRVPKHLLDLHLHPLLSKLAAW